MDEWQLTRLGDHISLKGGLSYKSAFVGKGDTLLVGMGCVSHTERFLLGGVKCYGGECSESHRVRPGDLVIATRQQSDNLPILGYPAIIPDALRERDVIVATNVYKITNSSKIDNRFLYWLLRSRDYRRRILECSKGTTVRMLTKDAIEDFEFLCPSAHERDRISTFLDSLQDKIELNQQMNRTLEAIAQSIFQDWFIDFGPTRAKMEGRAPYLAREIWSLFPAVFHLPYLAAMDMLRVRYDAHAHTARGRPLRAATYEIYPHLRRRIKI
jgi:type I restriction enzyme S subunit